MPSVSQVGFGSRQDVGSVFAAGLHAQKAVGLPWFWQTGIVPEQLLEVPHLHCPVAESHPSDPSCAWQNNTLLDGQRSIKHKVIKCIILIQLIKIILEYR